MSTHVLYIDEKTRKDKNINTSCFLILIVYELVMVRSFEIIR